MFDIRKERKSWVDVIWSHYAKAKADPMKFTPTDWWMCWRATIALWLGRERDYLLDHDWQDENGFDSENNTVAWANFSDYETDYGTGREWDYLIVGPWFTYAMGSDGSL